MWESSESLIFLINGVETIQLNIIVICVDLIDKVWCQK